MAHNLFFEVFGLGQKLNLKLVDNDIKLAYLFDTKLDTITRYLIISVPTALISTQCATFISYLLLEIAGRIDKRCNLN